MKSLPINEAQTNLSQIIDEIRSIRQPVTIIRDSRPVVTMIATEDLETLIDTLAWLSDPEQASQMAEVHEAMDRGWAVSLDQVSAMLAESR